MDEHDRPPKLFNRRKFIGLAAAAAAFGAAYYYGLHTRSDTGFLLRQSRTMMGTIVNFSIIGPDRNSCEKALSATVEHMQRQGSVINTYAADSPLSRLNRQGVLDNCPPALLKVTRMALDMARLTGGAFDPTVYPLVGLYRQVKKNGALPPQHEIDRALSLVDYRKVFIEGDTIRYALPAMAMTLDGIGKGYIVDEGVRKINELGFGNVCIEAGGDLKVTGTKSSGDPWTIAIRNPRPEKENQQYILKMKDRAIATSGDYMQFFSEDRKYHHIINPATGFSPPELASCSILAPSVAQADGLATAAMVMGPEKALALLETLPGCDGFLIGKDLTTYTSKDFFS